MPTYGRLRTNVVRGGCLDFSAARSVGAQDGGRRVVVLTLRIASDEAPNDDRSATEWFQIHASRLNHRNFKLFNSQCLFEC